MVHRAVSWSVVVACAVSFPASALADKAAADKLLAEGRERMVAKDPKAACAKFEAAIGFAPSDIPIMLGLAVAGRF